MTHTDPLHLDVTTRREVWQAAGDAIEAYYHDVRHLGVRGHVDPGDARLAAEQFDFDNRLSPSEAVGRVVEALRRLGPHAIHPRHFGLFDPAPTAMGVVAEALAAAFNPCLASWEGSPFGVETERHLVTTFGRLFGYEPACADGVITSGGSEANLTSALLALQSRFPGHRTHGLQAVTGRPAIYASPHAHPSVLKAAAVIGLGITAVRRVPTDHRYRIDAAALDQLIRADVAAQRVPLLIVATAGTTDAGAVDPIADVIDVGARRRVWVHVDAAWGGAAILVPEIRGVLGGIDQADSITFDPHKWLSVPMGCGLLLTRHRGLLDRTFNVAAPFLADRAEAGADPYARSIRWSRNFAGLKLLLSLAVAGWQGYADALRRQVALAGRLRDALQSDGWVLRNETLLPVVCFTDESIERPALVARAVNQSGEARIFPVRLGGRIVLRACVTNYGTSAEDIDLLIKLLNRARADVRSGHLSQPSRTSRPRPAAA
ncbi:MAG TPA: pyridoxal-dependent decarboxylase [Streptosporangiaceae bacterium]|nr:pyridoxal-dependent decarboxylase [Streptosporangiaceae bacterium]